MLQRYYPTLQAEKDPELSASPGKLPPRLKPFSTWQRRKSKRPLSQLRTLDCPPCCHGVRPSPSDVVDAGLRGILGRKHYPKNAAPKAAFARFRFRSAQSRPCASDLGRIRKTGIRWGGGWPTKHCEVPLFATLGVKVWGLWSPPSSPVSGYKEKQTRQSWYLRWNVISAYCANFPETDSKISEWFNFTVLNYLKKMCSIIRSFIKTPLWQQRCNFSKSKRVWVYIFTGFIFLQFFFCVRKMISYPIFRMIIIYNVCFFII